MANRSALHPGLKTTCLAFLLMLSSCGLTPSSQVQGDAVPTAAVQVSTYEPFPLIGDVPSAPTPPALVRWQHYPLPGKQATSYLYDWIDGRHAMRASAKMSASMLRQSLHVAPDRLGVIKFSWKVPQLIVGADLAERETHDSPVRLALAFEGDRSKFSMKNSMLSELALALTGEPLPYATLMYVWCNACPQEQVLSSPRTDRIREIPLESGPTYLGQWREYQRDIRADYEKAFGEPPGALVGVGFMTDTDNTRGTAMAWYGAVSLAD